MTHESPDAPVRTALVIGAGVVGITTAYFLAKDGWKVSVLDRRPEAGLGTSHANGGLVSLGLGHPWNAPSTPKTILRWLGREQAPFLFRAKAIPGVASWGLRFLRNCSSDAYQRSTAASVRLLAYSQGKLREVVSDTGVAYDGLQNGILKIVSDRAALDADEAEARSLVGLGLSYKRLSSDACVALEPSIAPLSKNLAGGIFFSNDESGDACKFTQGLAAVCRQNGVRFHFNTRVLKLLASDGRVSGVETDQGLYKADHYVMAAGYASKSLSREIGIALPLYPVKGYSVTVETEGRVKMPLRPFIDWDRKICITPLGDRLRAAGTAEFAGEDTSVPAARWQPILDKVLEIFPALRDAGEIKPWAGFRPMTPDHIPVLGSTQYSNLTLNVGHGAQGWGLSCGSAALIANLMAGRQPDIDLAPYSSNRFKQ